MLTGEPFGGLLDVDMDAASALRFAPRFLPKTNCIFGRELSPRSHWIYRVPDAETHKQFNSNEMIVEVRGNKRYTVFPGSVHPSGEPIEFEGRSNFGTKPRHMERTSIGCYKYRQCKGAVRGLETWTAP